jgi:hypothetical protein
VTPLSRYKGITPAEELCHDKNPYQLKSPQMKIKNSDLLYEKAPHLNGLSFEPRSFCGQLRGIPTRPLPVGLLPAPGSFVSGVNDLYSNASVLSMINLVADARVFFPSEQLHQIVALACRPPQEWGRPVPAWSITELAQESVKQNYVESISRSTVWRLLDQAEIKPHKWRYWLHSKDPDFEKKMLHIVDLYLHPPEKAVLLCLDEKTAIHARGPKHCEFPMRAGQPYLRSHSYIHHGMKDLLAAFDVKTGKVFGLLYDGHSSFYWEQFLQSLCETYPPDQVLHFIIDNYATHSTPSLCSRIAKLCNVDLPNLPTQQQRRQWLAQPDKRLVFHFLPTRASWLNQVEVWFSTFSKRCLKRLNVVSVEDLIQKVTLFIQYYNLEFAHPYAWTYAGKPLQMGSRICEMV